MTQPSEPKLLNTQLIVGYALLLTSVFIYSLTEYLDPGRQGELLSIFILHYALALAYVFYLMTHNRLGARKSFRAENIHYTAVLMNLFLVSAFALNREIPVFEDSADWLCIFLVFTSVNLLSFRYFSVLPRWLNAMQLIVMGCSIAFYFYLALFIGEIYLFGSVGTLLLGIGAHAFVPALLLVTCYFTIKHTGLFRKAPLLWLTFGTAFTFAVISIFVVIWNQRVSSVSKLAHQSVLYPESELPVWAKVGQDISKDWLTLRILKGNLVYTTKSGRFSNRSFSFRNFEESRKHDPLVFIASFFSEIDLLQEDRIRILQAIFDSRHQTNERLWSGDNLKTSYVVTDVDIYPELRLAYTEKYLSIKNEVVRRVWWGNTQEAIYTFQLPEGSVITSLSLWVNGKEEKAILTSKQKAAEAYKTIVGVERRDPSVVHWQEGNTVTVRVFPCTDKEERKFKIGITSPLTELGGKILYKNISFKGPTPIGANETIRVRFMGNKVGTALSAGFVKDKKGDYLYEHTYNDDFEVAIDAPPLQKANQFTFNGFTYSLSPFTPVFERRVFKKIYLDINSTWTELETAELKKLVGNRIIMVYYEDEFIQLTPENWDITDDLLKRNFSLFPFHLISDVDHSLVVTKGKRLSPHLSDFKESKFAEGISKFFASGKKAFVYNLGNEVATFVGSLRELRSIEFAQGDATQLSNWIDNNKFPKTAETAESVVIHDAGLTISKMKASDTVAANTAPDHLARLFAYNDIMRQIGKDYFKNDFVNEELVDEATTAYVVSPVSSLIVLETKKDYEKFGIEDKENSLHNASKQSSGAVPEPHEWALIILFVLFVIYVRKFGLKGNG